MATSFRPAGMSDDDEDDDSLMDYHGGAPQVQVKTENLDADAIWRNKFDSDGNPDVIDKMESAENLCNAIATGNTDQVRLLLQSGVSCDEPLDIAFGSSGRKPIFIAAEEGQVKTVELLLEFGCNLDPEEGNFTPLMSTCGSVFHDREEDLAQCAVLLTTKGQMDPNACQTQKITGLMLACKHGHDEVVKKLLEIPSLNINAQDSQRWTALMYAIDGDHGHIARRLLEAGARPDLAGSEGVLPVDLAMTKGHANLQAIVGEYSKIRGIDLNMNKSNSNEDHLIQYSEVDNILLAVNANEYLPAFKHHRVNLTEFLLLNESDLINIGVEKVGLRKRILDVIADMHKRQWEKSSVPKIPPRDKQNGIFLSAPDGALLIASVGQHLKLLNANVEFLARHIREKPEMLKLGTDVATITDISKFTQESRQNLFLLNRTIEKLEVAVSKEAGENRNFPIDSHFGEHTLSRKWKRRKISVIVGFMTAAIAASFCYLKK